MLKIGDKIPEFSAIDQQGKTVDMSSLSGKALVIYFYPKDETKGCTAQACSFRDNYQDFLDAGAEVIGISGDNETKHEKFASKHNLPFILLSDGDKSLRNIFDVKRDLFGLIPGRETFVFDHEGRLIYKFRSQMQWGAHAEKALKLLQSK